MAQPDASYVLALKPREPGGNPRLVWDTRENGRPVEYDREPARSVWQRLEVGFFALFPLDREL
jgi:hypothetical protein